MIPMFHDETQDSSSSNGTSTENASTSCKEEALPVRYRRWILLAVHAFCVLVYAFPIVFNKPVSTLYGQPVFDERYVLKSKDVKGESPWYTSFAHDYWGYNMTSKSSHKSWRPLSVLSMRWITTDRLEENTTVTLSQLTVDRLVNVIIHAAAAEYVAQLGRNLLDAGQYSSPSSSLSNDEPLFWLHVLIKLCFVLHPTHVEATANVANRPHMLALLLGVLSSCDPSRSLWTLLLLQCMGLLVCETYVFQMPAMVLTLTVVALRRQQRKQRDSRHKDKHDSTLQLLLRAVRELRGRYVVLVASPLVYLAARHAFGTLIIPDLLIRPAENPFYEFRGLQRLRNYAYVLAIHIGKSLYLDWVGMAHEYGFDCIPALQDWTDPRLLAPLLMAVILCVVTFQCLKRGVEASILWLVHLAWMATLFPISGFIKVGTFVADRIVVTSTVSVSIFVGAAWSWWIEGGTMTTTTTTTSVRKQPPKRHWKVALLLVFVMVLWYRVHLRILDWMDNGALLESALRTCPRNAKVNAEVAKLYMGMDKNKTDLVKALELLVNAETIDPSNCGFHENIGVVLGKLKLHEMFEERMFKAMLCPFTRKKARKKWTKYWERQSDPAALKRKAMYSVMTKEINKSEKGWRDKVASDFGGSQLMERTNRIIEEVTARFEAAEEEEEESATGTGEVVAAADVNNNEDESEMNEALQTIPDQVLKAADELTVEEETIDEEIVIGDSEREQITEEAGSRRKLEMKTEQALTRENTESTTTKVEQDEAEEKEANNDETQTGTGEEHAVASREVADIDISGGEASPTDDDEEEL